ncbi:MAG: hypothetical protein M3348_17870 [Acidobacteriota bacterium]|nr:hypothetical protein [Acidobacteriota bacterium]
MRLGRPGLLTTKARGSRSSISIRRLTVVSCRFMLASPDELSIFLGEGASEAARNRSRYTRGRYS